jgi:hypothetical protein
LVPEAAVRQPFPGEPPLESVERRAVRTVLRRREGTMGATVLVLADTVAGPVETLRRPQVRLGDA